MLFGQPHLHFIIELVNPTNYPLWTESTTVHDNFVATHLNHLSTNDTQ